MRARLIGLTAAFVIAFTLFLASPDPAATPSVAAPVRVLSSPNGAVRAGVISRREAKPHHVRVARRVRITVSTPSPAAPAPVQSQPRTNTPVHTDGYHGSVAALIRSVFGSASSTALCIAWRESRFDPGARNPRSSASGLFQLTRIWWAGKWSFDPFNAYENAYHAHLMYEMYGWGPWGGGC